MTVEHWTGVEARLLRQARRMTVREFAAHLGITDRMISKWEAAGRNIRPHAASQAVLDESLRRCTPDEVQRFEDGRKSLPDDQPPPQHPMRWSLVIDLPPADVDLAQRIAAAVNAVLDSQRRC